MLLMEPLTPLAWVQLLPSLVTSREPLVPLLPIASSLPLTAPLHNPFQVKPSIMSRLHLEPHYSLKLVSPLPLGATLPIMAPLHTTQVQSILAPAARP